MTSSGAATETVQIRGLSAGGAGVGLLEEGRAVFVQRTAPGDQVQVDVLKRKSRWAKGRLVHVTRRSPVRRTPPCRYYADCGGCALQHLRYPAQLTGKRQIVEDALRRVGALELEVPPVRPSARVFRYRTRATFHVKRYGSRVVFAGFHTLERPGRILDVDGRCLLLHEDLASVWDALRAAWGSAASRLPRGRSLDLTLQLVDTGAVLTVRGGSGIGDPGGLLRDVAGLQAIWQVAPGGRRRLLAGSPDTTATRVSQPLSVRADAFLQVNRSAAEALHAEVMERAGDVGGMRVVDAYAGSGPYATALANRGAEVTAIERNPPAMRAIEQHAGVRRVTGMVETHLAHHLPADLVILNPPRAGVDREVARVLLERPARRILYVSCNPATLARDLSRLRAGYGVHAVTVHDLFPQTSHVETVVELTFMPNQKAGRP